MMLLRRAIAGLRRLVSRRRVEEDLDDEIRGFVEAAAREKIVAGMEPDQALRRARVEAGSAEALKDSVRAVGWESLVESLWQDGRYAIRTLRRSPGFAAVAVLALALGIGANTAIFSVLNSVLLRTLPVAEPQRLTVLSSRSAIDGGFTAGWDYAVWDAIRKRAEAFDGALAASAFIQRFNLAQGGEMQLVDGIFASGDYFRTLGVQPILGRAFTAADDARGGGPDGPVTVISYRLWQTRFAGAASVVGQSIVIQGVRFTIVGVTPPEFFGIEVGRQFDVALPIGTEPLLRGSGASLADGGPGLYMAIVLRLKPGQSIAAANAAVRTLQPQVFDAAFPRDHPLNREMTEYRSDPFTLVSAVSGTSELRQQYQPTLMTVFAIVGAVFLIACANLANLQLARASAREHELSVRRALGASNWRLTRQLVVESLVLAGLGGALGMFVAALGSQVLVAQLTTPFTQAFVLDLPFDWRVAAFGAVVTVLAALLFGTAPALRQLHVAPVEALTMANRSRSRPGRGRSLSSGLVVVQVALSLVLLIAAGLFLRTFERLASVPLGFERDRVLVVNVDATRALVAPAERLALYQRLTEAVSNVPGVAYAAASPATPFYGGPTPITPIKILNGATSERQSHPIGYFITPGWFAAYGTALRAGRDVDHRDTRSAPAVVVVNEAFVRKFLPDGNAIGRVVINPDVPPGEVPTPWTIVGVVADAVHFWQRAGAQPTMYHPLAQWAGGAAVPEISISVRSSGEPPARLAQRVAATLTGVDRNLEFSFRSLSDQVNASVAQERLVAALSGSFGALALLLAAIGLYGVTSYGAQRRQAEIGIRMALGARPSEVIGLVVRQSALLTAMGLVLGLTGAAAVTRYLEGMLFDLTPLDPTTFIGVSLLFTVVAMLAALLPARRATRIDPLVALRCE